MKWVHEVKHKYILIIKYLRLMISSQTLSYTQLPSDLYSVSD